MVKKFPLLRRLASYVFPKSLFKRPGSGGTFSSAYCYSVWLRHLVKLKESNLIENISDIKSIAEIGPGDSIGIGLAALYTGVERYYAFDVIKHANNSKNEFINAELLELFKNNTEIPHGTNQFRNTNPVLHSYKFPKEILNFNTDWYESRSNFIAENLKTMNQINSKINYIVPWMGIKQSTVKNLDLIISQAVMEHVYDIDFAYTEMYNWLKPGGIMSHQVDFKAHEMTDEWDGHFYIKSNLWKILAHGRKYPMNRLPLSTHLNSLEKAGFKIVNVVPVIRESNFKKHQTQVDGIQFDSNDLITSSALIQVIKS
jgi:hypothetical protein